LLQRRDATNSTDPPQLAQRWAFFKTVLTAASAAEALDVLAREHVDVLLADVAMPGEDGYSLLRKVRALSRTPMRAIPAAALTAFARDEDRREALAAGFQMHLAKPIDGHSLISAVSELRTALPDLPRQTA
jgi:CheY-like chemotaxis protein